MGSPAQPFLDWRDRLERLPGELEEALDKVPGAQFATNVAAKFGLGDGPAKPDPSWHNQMVQQANESFVKQAQQEQQQRARAAAARQKFKAMAQARNTAGAAGN